MNSVGHSSWRNHELDNISRRGVFSTSVKVISTRNSRQAPSILLTPIEDQKRSDEKNSFIERFCRSTISLLGLAPFLFLCSKVVIAKDRIAFRNQSEWVTVRQSYGWKSRLKEMRLSLDLKVFSSWKMWQRKRVSDSWLCKGKFSVTSCSLGVQSSPKGTKSFCNEFDICEGEGFPVHYPLRYSFNKLTYSVEPKRLSQEMTFFALSLINYPRIFCLNSQKFVSQLEFTFRPI